MCQVLKLFGRLRSAGPLWGNRCSRPGFGILAPEMATIIQDKEKFLQMPLEEKRQHYKNHLYTTLDKVPAWHDYYTKDELRLKTQLVSMYKDKELDIDKYSPNESFNKKVSLWRGDITSLEIDAIVNAANSSLLGGGGVDGAIHSAAGPELLKECKLLNGCPTGEAKITGGYKLPARYVIHTVGPRGENPELLQSCYEKSLQLVIKEQLRTVAFPCISTGVYGYPLEAAALVALKTVRRFLEKHPDAVDRIIFCVFVQNDVSLYECLMQLHFPLN